ncbi:MAG: VOC family protein [Spirochaetes bacterium]|nr:VOC family protein [Spirochaetota bacterium]
MKINQVSFGFTTDKVQETKEFYEKYLGATTIFEMEGYVNLKFGDSSTILGIEAPQSPEDKPTDSTGLGLGITVDDVDLAYDEITSKKLQIEMPLKDHPWGERGFGIKDPNGLLIYIYSITGEPAEEYKKYIKE